MSCIQGLSHTELYVELIRSSLMLVVDVVHRTDELKCAAFMFLKVSLSSSYCSNNYETSSDNLSAVCPALCICQLNMEDLSATKYPSFTE